MEFFVDTKKRTEVVDITDSVKGALKGNIKEGICIVHAPHATAGIIINEYEPNLEMDFLKFFERFVPKGNYEHNKIDDNAEAHMLSAFFGSGKAVPIVDGTLGLGMWQRILLCEFDGPKRRKIIVITR
jgi:secondary thiamine-phosphate synthase enzyme